MNPPAPSPEPCSALAGGLLLNYAPEGPLGGTFTCTRCGARAWQPDLLNHTPDCAYRPAQPPEASPPAGPGDGSVTPRHRC